MVKGQFVPGLQRMFGWGWRLFLYIVPIAISISGYVSGSMAVWLAAAAGVLATMDGTVVLTRKWQPHVETSQLMMAIGLVGILIFVGIGGAGFVLGQRRDAATANLSPLVAPLSVAEERYRLDLREFILSPLKESNDRFMGVMLGTLANYAQKNGDAQTLPFREIVGQALQSEIVEEYQRLEALAKSSPESMDKNLLETALSKYLLHYAIAQRAYLLNVERFTQSTLPPDALAPWYDADRECIRGFRSLKASPAADKIKEAPPDPFAQR